MEMEVEKMGMLMIHAHVPDQLPRHFELCIHCAYFPS